MHIIPWVINDYLALILDDVYLSCGVMEDSLLGVIIDVERRILPGEPDQDVVGAVDVGVLHVAPALHVLENVYSREFTENEQN